MKRAARFPFWVTIGYMVFAGVWIIAGDSLLRSLGVTNESLGAYHVPKSLLFIALTAGMLFVHTSSLVESRRRGSRVEALAGSRRGDTAAGSLIPIVGAATLVVLAVTGVGLNIRSDYDSAIADGRASGLDLSLALSHQVEQTISAVDMSLRGMSHRISTLASGVDQTQQLDELVASQQALLPEARSIFVLDASGHMLASSDHVPSGQSFADRDYFVALRDNPTRDLFLGDLLTSRVDGRYFIGAARAILDAHGKFIGVVAARIDPRFFERQFFDLDVGPHGVVALIAQSGVMVARSPPQSIPAATRFMQATRLQDPSRPVGSFIAKSQVDGRERLYAYRHLNNLPLTVIVGHDCDDLLVAWYRLLRNALTALSVFVIVVVVLATMLYRQVKRQSQLIDQLSVSELRFLSFLGNAPAMAWITDAEGTISYANEALARLVDADEEQLIGAMIDDILPASTGELHVEKIQSVATRLTNIESVGRFQGASGESELVIQYFALGEARGQHRVGGIALDVTSQRAAERAQALHDRVLTFSPHGVSICKVDGEMELIYVNPAYERITGYSAEEVVGKNPRFLQGSDRDQDALIEMRTALRERRETEVTLRNYRKDGTLFWNETRLAPVLDPNGSVTHWVGTLVDVTERKNFEAQLAFQGSHDLLTRLPNRALFEERLEQAIAAATKGDQMLAVAFIDVDDFQQCNDSLGRGGGDLLLRRVAERLERVVNIGDTVGRVGGDEFALVLTDHPTDESINLVFQRLFEQFAVPERFDDLEFPLSISAGVAMFSRDGTSVATLSKNAELAMNSAKDAGGGVVHWFESYMDRQAAEKMARESRLRRALERNELVLHYQPQIDAHTGRVIGVEALMRWQDPTIGLVFPGHFIPLAEETGLIVAMGEWAMFEACRQNRDWQSRGVLNAPIAVNVSMAQFRQSGFAQTVGRILNETGMSSKYLEIEITESLVMDDPELFISTLRELKRLGVCISIDDFGTGYSSLNYLKRLPIDKLKIDRSFVGDITADPDDAALCRSIVEIAHSLRLLAIAEGVETAAQSHFLARHHCDQLQGYLFCKPLPAADVEATFSQVFVTGVTDKIDAQPGSLILVVDDDEESARALVAAIDTKNVRIKIARSASEAFEILATDEVAVIISDYRMPDMNGVVLLARVKLLYPETIRMIVTAYPAYEQAADAINQAAIFKYLVKPWQPDALRNDIRNALELHRRLTENEQLRDTLDYSRERLARIIAH